MTKEITKARILQEIQDKFGMREFGVTKFLFDETVVPVYNVEQHLEKWTSCYFDVTVTGIDSYIFKTVPQNEKWTFWRYDVVFISGAFTIAGIYTRRHDRTASEFCYLDLTAAQNTSYHIQTSEPVVLVGGDKLVANVDGYTSTGDLRLYLDYEVEELR